MQNSAISSCGASQTGFGRTGTVRLANNQLKHLLLQQLMVKDIFVDTSGGAVTVNLPAGSAGSIVSIKDYAQNI